MFDLNQNQFIKIILILATFVFVLNGVRFYWLPLVPTDSTWTLSSLYDYLKNPELGTSIFAHEYLGALFNFNTLHFLLGPIFKVVELNTINFLILHFVIIGTTTILIWLLIDEKLIASLVILFYVLDGYTYGFRSESYNIMLSVIMLLGWKKISYNWIKISLSVFFVIFIGFLHPVGGVLICLSYLYLLLEDQNSSFPKTKYFKGYSILNRNIIFSLLVAALILFFFGIDKIYNISRVYLTPSNDTENHFDGLHLELMAKYLIFGSGFWFLVLTLPFFKRKEIILLLYLLLFISFLLVSGRSYYFPYLIIPALLLLMNKVNAEYIKNIILNKKLIVISIFGIGLFYIGLTTLKTGSAYKAKKAGNIFLSVLLNSHQIVGNNVNNLVFLPSQLSVENSKYSNQRIIFPSVRLTRNKEVAKGTNVLLYSSDQINWIENNPIVFGNISKWNADTIIPFREGIYSLSSNFVNQPKPEIYIGLVKYVKILD